MRKPPRAPSRLPGLLPAASLLVSLGLGCSPASDQIASYSYLCGNEPPPEAAPGAPRCGEGDPNLPPEPTLPADPADAACILTAVRRTPADGAVLPESGDPAELDTARVQAALNHCKGGVVKLTRDGDNDAFLTASITVDSAILWIDAGVTLFASRNPDLYQKTGNCGVLGVNDSGACNEYITVKGTSPGIVGDGVIDGQGGEPLVGHEYSWWQMSYALREIDGSIGNPTLVNVASGTTGLLLYRVTLHNSPKFHVKLTSAPADGVCDAPGKGFIVWGVTVLTPSRWTSSAGYKLTPSYARNSDGIDPGANSIAYCGVMACNTISTGDDHIAIKGGHWVENLIIAHNHFGTGHGMSIGSETYGSYTDKSGVVHRGVQNVTVYDLTIDADSRRVGVDAHASDFNGIRVKSDSSRGGLVDNITYRDVCMRDMVNAILVSTAYNPLFAGTSYPDFRRLTFQNVRHVTCMALQQPVVTLEGFNSTLPAGPVTLDNVVIDNISQPAVAAEFANITLGPGDVNFRPEGLGVTLTDTIDTSSTSTPRACSFPKLPAPEPPPGWLY